jgi:3-carboxy-cis,cis-muconate cycloisomerase
LPSDELFAPLFVPDAVRQAVSGRAWVAAMLDAERALAAAEARAGVIPAEAAAAIATACDPARFDPEQIGIAGRAVGNPAEPLVRALREAVGGDAADFVHYGATSQDILDTAATLVARRALEPILDDLAAVASACAGFADAHRDTVLAGRTLLQQAVPTTFGLKSAGWLVGVVEARRPLVVLRDRLPAQLGGAAGTLAALGDSGPEVLGHLADELGLAEPVLPWHALRTRIAEVGAALAIAAGACAKIALDVALLTQTEVAELAVADDGGSSTMPHKHNPVGAVLARACARHAAAHAGILTASLAVEHERAAGAWHAEWQALSGGLAAAGGAAASTRSTLDGLSVDPERMRRNLAEEALSERAASLLAERVGRARARELLTPGRPPREVLAEHLAADEVTRALEPAGYLGSAGVFVDRALELYRSELG